MARVIGIETEGTIVYIETEASDERIKGAIKMANDKVQWLDDYSIFFDEVEQLLADDFKTVDVKIFNGD